MDWDELLDEFRGRRIQTPQFEVGRILDMLGNRNAMPGQLLARIRLDSGEVVERNLAGCYSHHG